MESPRLQLKPRYSLCAGSRLQTQVNHLGILAQGHSALALLAVQQSKIECGQSHQDHDGRKEAKVSADAARVARRLVRPEEEGAENIARRGTGEDDGRGGLALRIASRVLRRPGVDEGC